MTKLTSTSGYADEVDDIFKRYEGRRSEDILAEVLPFFPDTPSDFLDIGAGTGRDAAYYASLGHHVWAVEPVAELRDGARHLHPHDRITWLDDGLPELRRVQALNQQFDMITLHAVWMHLDAAERRLALTHLITLMRPGGRLFLSQRHGPIPAGRRMFEISAEETVSLAQPMGLTTLYAQRGGLKASRECRSRCRMDPIGV